jgi:hypothetical protein
MFQFADWMIIPLVGIIAVFGMVFIHRVVNPPVEAQILAETATSTADGLVEVTIQWTFVSSPDDVETATVRVTQTQLDEGTILVWRDGKDRITTVDPRYQLNAGDYILAFALGALLGAVMVMTVRGYGYVRGTGEPGSRPSVDVAEDRGFYWRT